MKDAVGHATAAKSRPRRTAQATFPPGRRYLRTGDARRSAGVNGWATGGETGSRAGGSTGAMEGARPQTTKAHDPAISTTRTPRR